MRFASLLSAAPAALWIPAVLGAFTLGTRLADDGPQPEVLTVSGFAIEHEIVVPGTPVEIFDAFTGDVRDWWDHHYSEQPVALVIEPKAGGRFYELFDDEGNGVTHADVTLSNRGKELIFRGPLGFGAMGVHFDMVHRFTFEAVDGEEAPATRVKVTVRGIGEIQEGWDLAVQGVWRHFLSERFEPHVRSGAHR